MAKKHKESKNMAKKHKESKKSAPEKDPEDENSTGRTLEHPEAKTAEQAAEDNPEDYPNPAEDGGDTGENANDPEEDDYEGDGTQDQDDESGLAPEKAVAPEKDPDAEYICRLEVRENTQTFKAGERYKGEGLSNPERLRHLVDRGAIYARA